jgi:iron complex outermembrane receptor protein
MLNAGIRYDIGTLNTEAYYDWYATPQNNETSLYTQRSIPLKRTFNSLSWGIGAIWFSDKFSAKINAGKSFRMPTAKELASNGINYHMYRYEKGDTTLHAEQSYQLDMELSWNLNKLSIELSPFVNYFPNYIYLNPTSDYYEAQQVYYHSESEVLRTGGECSVSYKFTNQLTAVVDAEYVYSVQLSGAKKGFTLPFSPPLAVISGLKYTPGSKGVFGHPNFGIDFKLVATQNNIVPPEKKTSGYGLINLIAGTEIKTGELSFQLNVQAHNMLNTKYYDHTSFYRLIAVPGQGRNVVINLQIPL